MANDSSLALDITADVVAGVAYLESKQNVEVLSAHYCLLSESLSIEQAIGEILENCQITPGRCQISIGAEQFHYRLLHVPFSDLRKVRSIIPLELEENTSFEDNSFLYDYLLQPVDGEGTDVFAIMAAKPAVEELLEILDDKGIDPEVISVSGLTSIWNHLSRQKDQILTYALVQISWTRATIFTVVENELKAVRSIPVPPHGVPEPDLSGYMEAPEKELPPPFKDALRRLAADIRYSLVAAQSMGPGIDTIPLTCSGIAGNLQQVREFLGRELGISLVEITPRLDLEINNDTAPHGLAGAGYLDNAMALALCRQKDRGRINFRRDEFAFTGMAGSYNKVLKYAGGVLLLAAVAVFTHQAVSYQNMKSERQELAAQIESLYRQTVPDSSPGPEPLKQLQVKLREMGGVSATGTIKDPTLTTVKLLADISSRIPASIEVSFERLLYDRKMVRIRGMTDNFNTIDLMKSRLAQSPLFTEVTIGSANVDPKAKGVRFELKIQL